VSENSNNGGENGEKKKDLTGILELSSLMPPTSAEEFLAESTENAEKTEGTEDIQEFATLDSLGQVDPDLLELPPEESTFEAEPISAGPTPTEPDPALTEIKAYAERSLETMLISDVKVPFHLLMSGAFDPFARDKLLLFITENQIGLSSSELDRQISAGRVLFPRISEFAGIKLIQELRDSGLSFQLKLSSRDEDEILPQSPGVRIEYDANNILSNPAPLPVVPVEAIQPEVWEVFDTIQVIQFLKAEMVEVEHSELFQELLERMTLSLKHKAKIKGAAAVSSLKHTLNPLRLPSHYQVELSASLLKKP
jgi:hypothetical protein